MSEVIVSLKEQVKKLRKEKARLKSRLKATKENPDWFEASGNNGGSYVRIQRTLDRHNRVVVGVVSLEVGETCVRTIKQDISVVGLAAILTRCKDIGFQNVVNDYLSTSSAAGCPIISITHDLPPKAANKAQGESSC